jgi:hypothetical protein
MSTSAAVAIAPDVRLSRERMERQFYLLAGCVFLIFVGLGFQQFYLHGKNFIGRPVTPQIAPIVVVHGIGMSAWIIFLIVQSSLIVSGNRKLHMSLGVGGAVLAGFLVVLGFFTATRSAHYRPNSFAFYGGVQHFLIVPLTDIVGFGVLVAVGFRYRRKPEIHRPMMCLATLFAIAAAFARISFIRGPLGAALHGSVFAVLTGWIPMLTLGLLLVLGKWLMTRTWDHYFARGWAVMACACALQLFVATTAAWSRLAALLTS